MIKKIKLKLIKNPWIRYAQRYYRSFFLKGFEWTKNFKGSPKLRKSSTKVLVATSVSGHLTALNFESMIAKSLAIRNCEVNALICDGVLPSCMDCDNRFFPNKNRINSLINNGPRELCVSCTKVGEKIYKGLGVRLIKYSENLTEENYLEAKEIVERVNVNKIREYLYENIPVGEHAYAGALRFYARGDIDNEIMSQNMLQTYFMASLLSMFMMRNLLKREKYEVCFLNHGIYVPQGILAEVCRSMGVRVVTWNPAYRKSCFILSHDTTYHHTLMNEDVSSWQNMNWNEDLEQGLMEYLKSRMTGSNDWIWFHDKPEFDIKEIEDELKIDLNKPTTGLLTNVIWDAQLHYPANAFKDMMSWIIESIKWFSNNPDQQLVIRIHPAEISGSLPSRQKVEDEILAAFQNIPKNIFIISPESKISTYAIMSKCNSVLIYGTKTGVELTSIGIPVIVAGEAWIRNKGISIDCSTKDEYISALEELPFIERMPRDKITLARKYAFHFFFRRMIEIPFMQKRLGWPSIEPILKDAHVLEEGKCKGLDIVCNGIIRGTPFISKAEESL